MADTFISWKSVYNVGIDSIDKQHKQLFILANKVYDAQNLRIADKEDYIKSLLKQSVALTISHFEYEEQLMKKYHYPGYAQHLKEHNDLRKRLQEEVSRISKTNRIDTFRLAQFIKDWMMHHVAISDNDYKIYFIKTGLITQGSSGNSIE